MANPIRDWNDLSDPGIDPFEFPAELPEHFTEVAALLNEEAGVFEDAVEEARRGGDVFGDYVEYLNTARVVPSVVGPMADAHEEINTAVSLIQQAAEAMARAATLAKQARRAAEDAYGDWDVPRFDQAG